MLDETTIKRAGLDVLHKNRPLLLLELKRLPRFFASLMSLLREPSSISRPPRDMSRSRSHMACDFAIKSLEDVDVEVVSCGT